MFLWGSVLGSWQVPGKYLGSQPEFFLFTREYTVSEDGGITMGDSLMLYMYYLGSGMDTPWFGEPTMHFRPPQPLLGIPLSSCHRH